MTIPDGGREQHPEGAESKQADNGRGLPLHAPRFVLESTSISSNVDEGTQRTAAAHIDRHPGAVMNLRKSKSAPIISLGELPVKDPTSEDMIEVLKDEARTAFEQEKEIDPGTFMENHEDVSDELEFEELQGLYKNWLDTLFLEDKGKSTEQMARETLEHASQEELGDWLTKPFSVYGMSSLELP